MSFLQRADSAYMVATDSLGHSWLFSRIYVPGIDWLGRLGRIFRGPFTVVSGHCLRVHPSVYRHAAKIRATEGNFYDAVSLTCESNTIPLVA